MSIIETFSQDDTFLHISQWKGKYYHNVLTHATTLCVFIPYTQRGAPYKHAAISVLRSWAFVFHRLNSEALTGVTHSIISSIKVRFNAPQGDIPSGRWQLDLFTGYRGNFAPGYNNLGSIKSQQPQMCGPKSRTDQVSLHTDFPGYSNSYDHHPRGKHPK